jgi:hypothetical protein
MLEEPTPETSFVLNTLKPMDNAQYDILITGGHLFIVKE